MAIERIIAHLVGNVYGHERIYNGTIYKVIALDKKTHNKIEEGFFKFKRQPGAMLHVCPEVLQAVAEGKVSICMKKNNSWQLHKVLKNDRETEGFLYDLKKIY